MILFWIAAGTGAFLGVVAGLLAWHERATRRSAYEHLEQSIREVLGRKKEEP